MYSLGSVLTGELTTLKISGKKLRRGRNTGIIKIQPLIGSLLQMMLELNCHDFISHLMLGMTL